MPVVLTFDLEGAEPLEHNRLQSMFERFGWENLGGTSYRYPRLGTKKQPVEDWFNHIVPALMLFRAFVINSSCGLKQFTLDVQSSSGFKSTTKFGSRPHSGSAMKSLKHKAKLYKPGNGAFGEKNLVEWLDDIDYPY